MSIIHHPAELFILHGSFLISFSCLLSTLHRLQSDNFWSVQYACNQTNNSEMPDLGILVRLFLALRGSIVIIDEDISFNIVWVFYSFYFTLFLYNWSYWLCKLPSGYWELNLGPQEGQPGRIASFFFFFKPLSHFLRLVL